MRTVASSSTYGVVQQDSTIDKGRTPMRITTFLNQTIGLPGLWVNGLRMEKPLGEKADVLL